MGVGEKASAHVRFEVGRVLHAMRQTRLSSPDQIRGGIFIKV